mgnify:CR=1 FL=1
MKYGQYKFNRGKYSTADLEEGASTVSVTSGVANVNAIRVRTSGALSAGVTVVTTVANLTSVGASTISASSVTDPRGGFAHTADINDVNTSSAIVASGRKKWELIGEGSETWTPIAA